MISDFAPGQQNQTHQHISILLICPRKWNGILNFSLANRQKSIYKKYVSVISDWSISVDERLANNWFIFFSKHELPRN